VVDEEWCVIFLVPMCFSCGVVVLFRRCALILVKRCIPFILSVVRRVVGWSRFIGNRVKVPRYAAVLSWCLGVTNHSKS